MFSFLVKNIEVSGLAVVDISQPWSDVYRFAWRFN